MKLKYPTHTNNYSVEERVTFEVEICEDCIFSSEGINEGFDPDGEDTFDICPEWDSWDFSFTYSDDDPDDEGEPVYGFSKSQCDGCHTSLYGDRHTMIATYFGPTKETA